MKVRTAKAPAVGSPMIVGMYDDRVPAVGTPEIADEHRALVDGVFESVGFTGELGQSAVVSTSVGTTVYVGLGDELDTEKLRQAAATGRKAVSSARELATTLHQVDLDGALGAVLDGIALADYAFTRLKSDPEERSELELQLVDPPKTWKDAVARSETLIGSVSLARDLVNTPPRDKAPQDLASSVLSRAKAAGLGVEIWDVPKLEKEGMGGILGVGGGSHRPPCLLVLKHRVRRADSRLALVGKGITFDSGGLSLKQGKMMETMKTDMAGAAAVIGAMLAIADLGLDVDVVGYAPLAENLPGGGAQRPGDVLTARNGKTIEVMNTDAEGRLVLADALALAAEDEPDLIVDIATLTGACKVALGEKIAGLWTNDQEAGDRVAAAAAAAGERVWPMPQPADYWSLIESDIADMQNTSSSRYGSAMAATLLLEQFVDGRPWAHLDIAGPSWATKAEHYIPKGGTGFGVRTLVHLAESMTS